MNLRKVGREIVGGKEIAAAEKLTAAAAEAIGGFDLKIETFAVDAVVVGTAVVGAVEIVAVEAIGGFDLKIETFAVVAVEVVAVEVVVVEVVAVEVVVVEVVVVEVVAAAAVEEFD